MKHCFCKKGTTAGINNRVHAGLILDVVVGFFNLLNTSTCTMALESTQPLTEMSIRKLPRGKGWPARKTDNLTIVCESIV
jgi:hypothetical protein